MGKKVKICEKEKENLGKVNWNRHLLTCINKNDDKSNGQKQREARKAENRQRKKNNTHGSETLLFFFKTSEN